MEFEGFYNTHCNDVQSLNENNDAKNGYNLRHTLFDEGISYENACEMLPMLNNIHNNDEGKDDGQHKS